MARASSSTLEVQPPANAASESVIDFRERIGAAARDDAEAVSSTSAHDIRQVRALRILLAEDSAMLQMEVEGLLEGHGVILEIASDGAEALERFQQGSFDLVLMDIDMPVVDGLAAMRAIRGLERVRGARPTRLVTFTARDAAELQRRVKGLGVMAHLPKPLNAEALYDLVDRVATSLSGAPEAEINPANPLPPTGLRGCTT